MPGAYAYSPSIWPPLAAAAFLAALSLYSWRRRNVPGAAPLAAGALFGTLWLLGIVMEAAAVAPETTIAWHKFGAVWQLAGITSTTCFVLEYTSPGRWLTRRNLFLLALPPLVVMLMIVTGGSRLMWRQLEVGPDGTIALEYALPGTIVVVYGVGLILINTAAFLSLFLRSPQHRWPVAIMLLGETAARGLFLASFADLPLSPLLDSTTAQIVVVWTAYATALFGFSILDPLVAARQTVVQQMREGMVIFDDRWRIVSVNPAAARILGAPAAQLRGKSWQEVLPIPENLPGQTLPSLSTGDTPPDLAEISLVAGAAVRRYALDLSLLKDPRGLDVGRLLLLLDTTEQRQAQAQVQEQQRTLAVMRERERLARELHDGLGQVLAFVNAQGLSARRLLTRGDVAGADAQLARLVEVAREADTDIREAILGLRVALSEPGAPGQRLLPALAAYLRQFEARHGIHTELRAPAGFDDRVFDPQVDAELLRIVQEALTNTRKHAGARAVCVTLAIEDRCARVTVEDDGCGFEPDEVFAATGGRVGLRVMRERAEEIGGSLAVQSAPGQGAKIIVTAPLRKAGPGIRV